MKGYIFESEDGFFLTKGLFWYPHENIKDAFVHPKESLRTILEISEQEWDNKIVKIHLVQYNGREFEKVSIIDARQNIESIKTPDRCVCKERAWTPLSLDNRLCVQCSICGKMYAVEELVLRLFDSEDKLYNVSSGIIDECIRKENDLKELRQEMKAKGLV